MILNLVYFVCLVLWFVVPFLVLFQLANFTYLNLQKPILNINFLNILQIINVRFYFVLYAVHR